MASPDRHFANAAIFTHSTGLTPNSGDAALYIKSDNKAYIKDSAGNEAPVATIGGTSGTIDNAIVRADGTGGATVQSSDINVDDATTTTQSNVAITNQHAGQTNSALVLTPKGTGAFILGPKPDGTTTGGNARGTNAVDLQTNRTGASQVASGADSIVAGGARNTASGSNSIAIGGRAGVASLSYATVLGGLDNVASGDSSIVCGAGGSSATAAYGSAFGAHRALADRRSMQAHASGQFSAQGDAQRARFVMRNKTTTNAAVELFLDGSSTRLTIPSGKSVGGTIQISGVTSGGETANLYIRQFLIRNRGGTTALIGSINTIGTDIEGITAADVTLTADDTNDSLKVEVTGYTPVTGMTGTASTDLINKVAHGFNNNDDIVFTSLTGGTGLTANTVTYWVINANPDDFQVSATRGGGAVNILTDYTDMTATRVMRWVANADCTEIGHGT